MKLTHHLSRAARAALQWRLMLVWLACTVLPTALAALPVWSTLSATLDHSMQAPALAQGLDLSALFDIVNAFRSNPAGLQSAALGALALTLLLSPFLSGAVVSAARHDGRAPFAVLFEGGLREYPRMFRMLLWSAVPLGVAFALGSRLTALATEHAEQALTYGAARPWLMAATAATALLLLFANATLDAGRAALAIDRRRSSAVKGWWRGLALLRRRPGALLGLYAALTAAGLLLAGLLGLARIHLVGATLPGFIAALLLTQCVVLVIAWMRSARLFALVSLAGIVHKD